MSPLTPQEFRKVEYIHRAGLAADRPAATDVLIGTLYFSTDTTVLERSNGTIWESYAGAAPPGPPAAHQASHQPLGSDELLNNAWLAEPNTFTNKQIIASGWPGITIQGTDNIPMIQYFEPGAPLDEKRWQLFVNNSQMILQCSDDGITVSLSHPLTILRTGQVTTPIFQTAEIANSTGLAHGSFTPTATGIANIGGETPGVAQYLRVGNTVTVSGSIAVVAADAVGSIASFSVSIPVNSGFTAGTSQLAGIVSATWGDVGACYAGSSNTARFDYTIVTVGSLTLYYHYTYLVVP